MTNTDKVLNYFKKQGWNPIQKKPSHIKWSTIGDSLGMTAEAARALHKRYRLGSIEPSLQQEIEEVEIATPVLNKKVFTEPGLYIILGCMHTPFHNKALFNGICDLIINIGNDIKGFILAGDFLDLNSLSGHDRGRFTAIPGLDLTVEYTAGNVILNLFDSLLPKTCEKAFLFGNHEDRAYRFMADMQNAKTPIVLPIEGLGLYERGYNVHDKWNQDAIKLGEHLEILHGIYWNQYATKKHLDVLRTSCLFYHTHRIQSYVEGNSAAFNGGFLGDIASPVFNYASRGMKSQWQNGFNIVQIDENGDFFMNQIITCNNRFVYNGKIYK